MCTCVWLLEAGVSLFKTSWAQIYERYVVTNKINSKRTQVGGGRVGGWGGGGPLLAAATQARRGGRRERGWVVGGTELLAAHLGLVGCASWQPAVRASEEYPCVITYLS